MQEKITALHKNSINVIYFLTLIIEYFIILCLLLIFIYLFENVKTNNILRNTQPNKRTVA